MTKTKSWKSRASLGVLAGLFACQLSAETLTDALVSAYNNSDLLDQNRAVLRAADEDVAIAVSALRPTLNYTASRDYGFYGSNNFDRDTISNTLGLTSQLSIYEFGRNTLAIEAAKEAVLAARQSLLDQEQQVLFEAVQAYMDMRSSLEFVELGENNVRVLEEEVRAANDRFEVGEVTRTDVAQAQSRLALAEANLVAAQGDLATARENYNLAVGRYPGNLAPPPALPRIANSEADARAVAVRGHPQILQAQRLVTVSEINIARAEAAVLPSLTANAFVGYSNRLDQEFKDDLEPDARIGIELSGPIYRGGALNSTYRSAVAQRDQNRAQLLRTTSIISQRVGIAWSTREVARASLQATERQIEASQIAFEGTREEATLGARTTLDVLNAEQELLNARADQIEANTQEQIAVYGLLAAMGQLQVQTLGLPVITYDPAIYYNTVRNAPVGKSSQGVQLDNLLKSIGKY